MPEVTPPEQQAAAKKIIRLMAVYKEAEDLINIGAYVRGSNPLIDTAIRHMPVINEFLQQEINAKFSLEESRDEVIRIAAAIEDGKKPDPGEQG